MPGLPKMTVTPQVADVPQSWFVVDAADKVLGRLASEVASVLRGKHKPLFTPHLDLGDFVIVLNCEQVKLTGRKREDKVYQRHTGYPGSIRTVTAGKMLEEHPERVIEHAVRGMLPKNQLGRNMLRKLKIYAGAEHPHAAQQPKTLEIRG